MYTFWNMMILLSVYLICLKYADGTLLSFMRMSFCMVVIWAIGYQFKLETYYVPLWAVGFQILLTPVAIFVQRKFKKHILVNKD